MSTPFQNRLVGTIIVAAVAIIVLPDLLDGNKKTYQDEFEQIPPPPKVNFVKTERAFPHDKVATITEKELSDEIELDASLTLNELPAKSEAASANETVQVNAIKKDTAIVIKVTKSQPITQTPKSKLPEKSVLKQAWVVQLGSFRHKTNVAKLLLKLKDNGYTAFTKPIKTKNGTLIKVFIGPELIQSSLKKKIPALKKLTGVQGKIARFYPTN